ncbi:MAG: SIS domain-containing protein [bacterium]
MPDKMHQWLQDFPQFFYHAVQLGNEFAAKIRDVKEIRSICFLGIGGSAIGAEIVCNLFHSAFHYPVVVSRGSAPPGWVKEGVVAVAVSYSGETKETIAAFQKSRDSGAIVISISSGGKLAQLNENRHLLIPTDIAPRAALCYTCVPLVFILRQAGAILETEIDVARIVKTLENIRRHWGGAQGKGSEAAKQIQDSLAIIASGGCNAAAGRRAQAQFAENAKTPAIWFDIPESLHNLLETLNSAQLRAAKPYGLMLLDPKDTEICTLTKITEEIFREAGIPLMEIEAQGESSLERTFSLIYQMDWLSYHLANLRGIDPVEIPLIKSVKKKQEERTANPR